MYHNPDIILGAVLTDFCKSTSSSTCVSHCNSLGGVTWNFPFVTLKIYLQVLESFTCYSRMSAELRVGVGTGNYAKRRNRPTYPFHQIRQCRPETIMKNYAYLSHVGTRR